MRGCSQWGSSNYRYFRISALDVSTRDSALIMSEYEIQAEKIWIPPSRMKSINALISTSQSLALPIFANHVFHFTGMIQEASDFNEWVDQ